MKALITSFLLLISVLSAAQTVLRVDALDADGNKIKSATGFFIDSRGNGVSLASILQGAKSVKVYSSANTAHNITRITGYDPDNDLIRFSVDNNLAISASSPAFSTTFDGQLLVAADPYQVNKKNISSTKTIEIPGFGIYGLTNETDGLVTTGNSVSGLISNGIIIPSGIIKNIPSVNFLPDDFITAFSRQDQLNAIRYLSEEKWKEAQKSVSASTVQASFIKGYAYYLDGFLNEADVQFRQVVAQRTNHAPSHYYIAKIALENDQLGVVVDFLTKALESGSTEPDIYAVRGQAYYDMANFQAASADFARAVSGDAPASVYYNYANTEFQKKSYPTAIENYTRAISKGLENVQIYNNRGEAYLMTGNVTDALNDLKKAVSLDAEYTKAFFNLAKASFQNEDWQATVEAAAKAKALGGGNGELDFYKGGAHFKLKQYDQAIEALQNAINQGKTDKNVYVMLGEAHFAKENYAEVITNLKSRASDPSDLRMLGIAQFRTGQYADAVSTLTPLASQFTTDLIFQETLGLAEVQAGDEPGARPYLTNAVNASSENADIYKYLGRILYNANEVVEAKEKLLQAQTFGARDQWIDVLLGEIAFEGGDYQLTINEFQKAGADNLGGEDWVRSGIAYYKLNNLSEAKNSFQQASSKGVNTAELHGWYGRTMFQLGEFDAARTELSKSIDQQRDGNVWYAYAGSLFETGNFETCIKAAQQAITLGSTEPKLQYWIGISAVNTNNPLLAAPALTKAIENGLTDKNIYKSLADIEFRKNNYTSAITNYDQAEKLGYQEADLYLSRGKSKYTTSDKTGAQADLTRAIEKNQSLGEAYGLRARIYFEDKKFAQAEADIQSLEQLATASANEVAILGLSQFYQDKFENAKANLERAKRIGSVPTEVDDALGSISFTLKNFNDVVKYLEPRVATLNPQELFWLGDAYYELKNYEKAALYLQQSSGKGYQELKLKEALGNSYYALKKYAEAAITLQEAVNQGSNEADVLKNLGNAYFRIEKYTEAITSYNKAVAADAQDAVIFNNRGKAKLLINQPEAAVEDFNQAISIDPEYIQAISNRGQARYALRRYAEALEDFNRLIDKKAADGEAYYFAGLSAFYSSQIPVAIDYLSTAETQGKTGEEGFRARAKSYFQQEKYEEADADFARAGTTLLAADLAEWGDTQFFLEKYSNAISTYERAGQANLSAIQLYHFGKSVYETDKYEVAASLFTAAINKDKSIGEAWAWRGNTRFLTNDYEGAIADYDQAFANGVDDAVFYNNRGKAYYYLEEKEKAVEDYTQAIKRDDSYGKAYENRGIAYFELDQFDNAISDFRAMEELAEGDPRSYLMLGLAYHTLEDFPLSIAYLERAEEAGIKEYELYLRRAEGHMMVEQFQAAMNDYGSALELNTTSEAYQGRARAAFYIGQDRVALDDAGNAIRLAPENPSVYMDRAAMHMELENFADAANDYRKAIDLNPKDIEAYYYIAEAYYAIDQFKTALDALDAAKELDDSRAEFYNLSAIIKYQTDDAEGACADWQKAVDLGDDNAKSSISRYCR